MPAALVARTAVLNEGNEKDNRKNLSHHGCVSMSVDVLTVIKSNGFLYAEHTFKNSFSDPRGRQIGGSSLSKYDPLDQPTKVLIRHLLARLKDPKPK